MTIQYTLNQETNVHGFLVDEVFTNYREAVGALTIDSDKHKDIEFSLSKVEILKTTCEFADYDDLDTEEGERTVVVTVQANIDDKFYEATFHVQMTDYEYNTQLGCWITTESGEDMDFTREEKIIFECADVVRDAEKHIAS